MKPVEAHADLSKLRLLVIDDDVSVLSLTCSMLKQLGMKKVLSSQNSATAFEIFRAYQNEIDIVLCDWNMPGMSGIELLKVVRSLRSDIDFIMVTGLGEMAKVVEARESGAIGYLKKPFSFDELRKKLTVASRIRSHRAASAA